jgi:hypothetical protein
MLSECTRTNCKDGTPGKLTAVDVGSLRLHEMPAMLTARMKESNSACIVQPQEEFIL